MDEKEKKHSTDSKDAERSFVIINGKRVYGINAETDEVVSAGKVYPIYTFESNHLEDSWVCSICDTENPERSSSCCVCGQARTSKNKAQSKFEKHSNWRQDEHMPCSMLVASMARVDTRLHSVCITENQPTAIWTVLLNG